MLDSNLENGRTQRNDTPKWLLRKYDVAAPRYTSYPAIPHWGEASPAQVEAWIGEKSPQPQGSLSLYVHIPFCASRCLYCGCFVIITSKREQAALYVEAVKKEMRIVRGHLPGDPAPVSQFHLGGGTPTFLSPGQLEGLLAEARSLFPFQQEAEMGIEIDPRTVDEAYLRRLRKMGINRISLGVQDFDEKVMRTVNRLQTFEQVEALVTAGRRMGFHSINFDLIHGLPGQTEASFSSTLEQVRQLAPDRLAIYNYAHLPEIFPHQRRLPVEDLPDADTRIALIGLARRKLEDWGYLQIGLDHFARPGDELSLALKSGTLRRNFMGYTTQAGTDQLAFGVSAISEYHRSFWQNEKKLIAYYRTVDAGQLPVVRGICLNDEDLLRKHVISSLFCRGRIDYEAIGRQFDVDFESFMADELEALKPMANDGLIAWDAGGLRVTKLGRLFLRNIAMVFDPYFRREGARREGARRKGAQRYSRAV